MLKNNIQDYFIFELEYKATNGSEIKLFDYRFVDKNKNKCKIIYNETEYDLTKSFEFNNKSIQNNSIKIKLKINKDIKDISHMFSNCKELLSIRDNSFYNYDITNIYELMILMELRREKSFMVEVLHCPPFKGMQIFLYLLE